MDKCQVTFDYPDGSAKGWILSNSNVSVAKSIAWDGIVEQTIIGPFNEAVKLISNNVCDFMNKIFFIWYKS